MFVIIQHTGIQTDLAQPEYKSESSLCLMNVDEIELLLPGLVVEVSNVD